MTRTERSFPVAIRALAAACALVALSAFAPITAGATPPVTTQADVNTQLAKVQAARDKLARLSAKKASIQRRLDAATADLDRQESALEEVTAELTATQDRIDAANARYETIQQRLNERAAEAFMQGPGSTLEVILGAGSIADLSDRMEYVNTLAQSDAALASRVENLRNSLAIDEANLRVLQAKREQQVADAQAKEQQIQAGLARVTTLTSRMSSVYASAQSALAKVRKQKAAYDKYERQLRQAVASSPTPSVRLPAGFVNPLQTCPVQGAVSFTDGFGAPRYTGGYHLHQGVDISAATGTPIVAPFDGTAASSYSTLGGNNVTVYGAGGYVFNAHLSSYTSLSDGPVHTGDVIGYVGETGDAIGSHDHFEWHPSVVPSNWPASSYGYSVIDGAVNPYPLLANVC
ncbi:MAG: murein hydrolase activator EnvC family protein [Planctomycetaceae bacterium]